MEDLVFLNRLSEYAGNNTEPDRNNELKWESTKQYDLGLDFGFLKNQRIRGSLGFYKKTTKGLLYPFTMALSTGMGSTSVNFANIENKGVEFDISATIIQNKDWNWSFGFNIGKNKNKITGLDAEYISAPGQTYLSNTVIREGESLGLIYGFETDGCSVPRQKLTTTNH